MWIRKLCDVPNGDEALISDVLEAADGHLGGQLGGTAIEKIPCKYLGEKRDGVTELVNEIVDLQRVM